MPGKTMRENDIAFDVLHTCSAHDCTGLVAAQPVSEAQWEAYQDIYDFGLPRVDQRRLEEG